MGLDLWFREDIARILHGLARTASRHNGEYQRGYADALGDIAASLGIQLQDVVRTARLPSDNGGQVIDAWQVRAQR